MSVRDLIILGCSSQQPTRLRNHGAYLLRWNEEGLLFDPGEGTQRQFIFANVAPPTVTRIFISHFHGDHCLGLGSMFMRLNLDKVTHPIHCYYPASGKKYFDRLRFGSAYRDNLNIIEHPVDKEGLVHQDEAFIISAVFLEHGIENIGWRVEEPPERKFYPEKIKEKNLRGKEMQTLLKEGSLEWNGETITLEAISYIRRGDVFSAVIDTKYCQKAIDIAENATLLLCESTYEDKDKELAEAHLHLNASLAATIAKKANVKTLVLTHFSARYLSLDTMHEEAKKIFPNTIMAEDLKVIPFDKTGIA